MKQKSAESRVKARKWGGDDMYSWAVFVDGFMKWNGMSRDEASWRKETEIKRLKEKANAKAN